jgi:DNA-directed RNA polymerase subunit RPC12/RpoP
MKKDDVVSPTHETWRQRIRRAHQGRIRDELLKNGKEGARVYLHFNRENGEWRWAIGADDDYGLWLNTCLTYDAAVRFCKAMKWEIVGQSADLGWERTKEDEGDDVPRCPYCNTENNVGKGRAFCRACGREFESFEIPSGIVFYCTRSLG